MTIHERFTLMVKGSLNAFLDSIEDPERSLHQLVLDMEEELDAAKRAASRALANEERLAARADFYRGEAKSWQESAERALANGHEADARQALARVERAERQRDALLAQLESQSKDCAEIRDSIVRLADRVDEARRRLQVLQARIRQGEARRAISRVLTTVESGNRYGEFERLSERVERSCASERCYQRLDAEIAGDDLKRRLDDAVLDHAVDERMKKLRIEVLAKEVAP